MRRAVCLDHAQARRPTPQKVSDFNDDIMFAGTFYVNGPGRIRIGGKRYGHWFDGARVSVRPCSTLAP